MPKSFLVRFNDFILLPNFQERASGWQLYSGLFIVMVARYGPKERLKKGQHFISQFHETYENLKDMKMICKILTVTVLCFILHEFSFAQKNNMAFRHLTTVDGLSQSYIYTI